MILANVSCVLSSPGHSRDGSMTYLPDIAIAITCLIYIPGNPHPTSPGLPKPCIESRKTQRYRGPRVCTIHIHRIISVYPEARESTLGVEYNVDSQTVTFC